MNALLKYTFCASVALLTLPAFGVDRVACVGDSITQGVGATKGDSYPAQLQRLLGEEWQVQNYGVSGRTLLKKGDHPYWIEKAYAKALGSQPSAVIIMLGTNDTKPQNWKFKDEFVADYRELVQSFQKLEPKPRIFVCRPVPVPAPGNYGINEEGIQEQIPLVDALAQELGASVIDMHAALETQPEAFPDCVHPNTSGAAEMAKAAFTALTGKPAPASVPPKPPEPLKDPATPATPAPMPAPAAPAAK